MFVDACVLLILTEMQMTAEFLKNSMIILTANEMIKFVVGCVYSLTSSPHAGLLRCVFLILMQILVARLSF